MYIYLESSVLSTEKDINTRLAKALTALDRLLFIFIPFKKLPPVKSCPYWRSWVN